MPPKRKGNGYLEQILQMKKQRTEEAAVVGQSSDGRPRPSENVFFKFKAGLLVLTHRGGTLHKIDGAALFFRWMST